MSSLHLLADDSYLFPPDNAALESHNGLIAADRQLNTTWLLTAYRRGIFPWSIQDGWVLWYRPTPRMILFPENIYLGKSFARVLKNRSYEIHVSKNFRQIMEHCAKQRAGNTWIEPLFIEAYCALHQMGFAHSVEVWREDRLLGGLYGVVLGRGFYGESMFSLEKDASKIALAHLCLRGQEEGLRFIDCQMHTEHLEKMGAGLCQAERFKQLLLENEGEMVLPFWKQWQKQPVSVKGRIHE